MQPREVVESLSSQLEEGETKNIRCPFCERDWQRQNRPIHWSPRVSMSVTREGHSLLYNCFRASCTSGRGAVLLLDSLHKHRLKEETKAESRFTPRPYRYRTTALTEHTVLTPEELANQHVRWAVDRKTIVYPIFDIYGREVGVVDRSDTRKPKAITYWFNDVPKIHLPLSSHAGADTIIVVEDTPSAIVAERYMRSAALLGTHISDRVGELLRNNFRHMYLALDADATTKAIKLVRKYEVFFDSLRPVVISKDIKDMSKEEADTLFRGL